MSRRRGISTQALRLVSSLVALALLVYLVVEQGWSEIWSGVQRLGWERIAVCMVLMLISRLAVAARWYSLVRWVERPLNFRQSLRITFAGLFASNFLPTTVGGDLVRLVGAGRHMDIVTAGASLMMDRLVGMAGMAVTVPLSFPVLWPQSVGLPASGVLWAGVGGGPAWVAWLRANLARAWQRLGDALQIWLRRPGALAAGLAYNAVHMLCLFLIMSLLLDGMGQHMAFWSIAGLYSLVYFVTLIPISINGYGLQELSMTLIFSNLGQAPMAVGLTTALMFRTLMMVASLPGALFVPDILAAIRRTHQAEVMP